MKAFASGHGISPIPSEHTGVFVSHTQKLGSIGVQVRHRLTTHGIALNVTREPVAWFEQVVACGLADVHAVSIATQTGQDVDVPLAIPTLVDQFRLKFSARLEPLSEEEPELFKVIKDVETLSASLEPPPSHPSQK